MKKIDKTYSLNPERINNPNLRCYICDDPIPLGDMCIEITFEKGIVYVCSDQCCEIAMEKE